MNSVEAVKTRAGTMRGWGRNIPDTLTTRPNGHRALHPSLRHHCAPIGSLLGGVRLEFAFDAHEGALGTHTGTRTCLTPSRAIPCPTYSPLRALVWTLLCALRPVLAFDAREGALRRYIVV